MNNPFLKNARTGLHNDIFSRSSHYQKILSCKPDLDSHLDKKYIRLGKRKDSAASVWDEDKNMNRKIVKCLTQICKAEPRYSERQRLKPSNRKHYRLKQRQLQISHENIQLCKKIQQASSDLSKQKLRDFSERMQEYARIKENSRDKVIQIDQTFFKTYLRMLPRQQVQPLEYTSQLNQLFKHTTQEEPQLLRKKVRNRKRTTLGNQLNEED